jgi:hypothetical protein
MSEYGERFAPEVGIGEKADAVALCADADYIELLTRRLLGSAVNEFLDVCRKL